MLAKAHSKESVDLEDIPASVATESQAATVLEAAALFFFGRGEEATRARREKAIMELENCILKD